MILLQIDPLRRCTFRDAGAAWLLGFVSPYSALLRNALDATAALLYKW